METKHTPEPWNLSWERCGHSWPGLFQLEENDILVYGMDGEEGIYANNEADFELINAAPETAAERDRLKAVNTELVKSLKEVEMLATQAILATPTSSYRNKLTEINIRRLAVLAKAQGVTQG